MEIQPSTSTKKDVAVLPTAVERFSNFLSGMNASGDHLQSDRRAEALAVG